MNTRALLFGGLAFLLALWIGVSFVRLDEKSRREIERRTVTEIGLTQAGEIEKQLDRVFAASLVVAASFDPLSQSPRFPAIAADVVRNYPTVSVVGLAPNGVLTAIYPDGSLDGELRREIVDDAGPAREAHDSRQFRLAGPFSRGRNGLVVRGYLPLSQTDGSDSGRLEGFAMVVSRVPDLVAASDLQNLIGRGYDYQLTHAAEGTRPVILARSTEFDLADPVRLAVKLRGGDWMLSIAPRRGWSVSPALPRGMMLAAVLALAAGLFVYDILRRPEILGREVERRTKRLTEANRLVVKEASQREQAERQRLHDAFHDALTRMPNRPNLLGQIAEALEQAKRDGAPGFAVLLLGVDRFTTVNDSHGPAVGDQLLTGIARRLETALPAGTQAARIGGDEFAVLLPGVVDEPSARMIAARLHHALAAPFALSGTAMFITASIGIAINSSVSSRPEDVLRDANLAMRRAKSAGGSRVGVFVREMHAQAVRLVAVERDLRLALERNELRAHYQPVVAIESGKITGFEALVRWQHPAEGLVPPAVFIPVAESTGLVVPVDRWIWREAARQIRDLQRPGTQQPPFSISVNLSARHLSEPDDLIRHVAQILDETGLNPANFRLEITESMMMENASSASAILARLKTLGIRILLDDFGTGYSSLSYLHELPIDVLKIDRSFISRLATDSKHGEIVRSIISMGRHLGFDVIAEGVETPDQLARLAELGCGFAQGWLFSRPVPAGDLQSFVNSYRPADAHRALQLR